MILAEEQLDYRLLIGRVVNGEISAEANGRGLAPEQAGAQRVKSGNPHRAAVGVEQLFDPFAHFLRGLVSEGDGHHLVRVGQPLRDQVGNAIRDDTRLARTRAGEDEERAVRLLYCFLLSRV